MMTKMDLSNLDFTNSKNKKDYEGEFVNKNIYYFTNIRSETNESSNYLSSSNFTNFINFLKANYDPSKEQIFRRFLSFYVDLDKHTTKRKLAILYLASHMPVFVRLLERIFNGSVSAMQISLYLNELSAANLLEEVDYKIASNFFRNWHINTKNFRAYSVPEDIKLLVLEFLSVVNFEIHDESGFFRAVLEYAKQQRQLVEKKRKIIHEIRNLTKAYLRKHKKANVSVATALSKAFAKKIQLLSYDEIFAIVSDEIENFKSNGDSDEQ